MAPPTTKPRLTTLEPQQVAFDVTLRALTEHRAATQALFAPAFVLAPAAEVSEDEGTLAKRTRLYKTLKLLAEYGQRGGQLPRPFRELLQRILPTVLQQCQFAPKAAVPDPVNYPEPVDALIARLDTLQDEEAITVVLRGAQAREQLEKNEPLTASQVAVLAGMGRFTISTLVKTGKLKGHKPRKDSEQKRDNPYLIQHAEARRFLRDNNIAGFIE
jgi:hypothetical protein